MGSKVLSIAHLQLCSDGCHSVRLLVQSKPAGQAGKMLEPLLPGESPQVAVVSHLCNSASKSLLPGTAIVCAVVVACMQATWQWHQSRAHAPFVATKPRAWQQQYLWPATAHTSG